MPDTTDRSLWRRGVATLRRFIVAHPAPFATSVAGSAVFALTAVLGTVVLGRVTDRVIIPAFEGDVASSTIWAGAIAIIVVAFIRSAGVITRRYFAGMTAAANMATLRHQIADRYLDVPLVVPPRAHDRHLARPRRQRRDGRGGGDQPAAVLDRPHAVDRLLAHRRSSRSTHCSRWSVSCCSRRCSR